MRIGWWMRAGRLNIVGSWSEEFVVGQLIVLKHHACQELEACVSSKLSACVQLHNG
jgi:Zn-dependent alcohol dehydrogenase